LLRFADYAADNCYTDCIAHDRPLLTTPMNLLPITCRVRIFGLALLAVVSFVGCQSGLQDRRDPNAAAQFKYAKQSAALMEMQERGERSVPGSIPSMGAFPLVSEQGAAVSDQ
jgi:hypothetical protein